MVVGATEIVAVAAGVLLLYPPPPPPQPPNAAASAENAMNLEIFDAIGRCVVMGVSPSL
jgi:hypothetical protein